MRSSTSPQCLGTKVIPVARDRCTRRACRSLKRSRTGAGWRMPSTTWARSCAGRAEALYERSLRLAEEIGDKHAIATALRSLGSVAAHGHDHARARRLYEDSIARFRELSDEFCVAKSLIGSAVAAHTAGDGERAVKLGDQGLDLLRETDAKGYLAFCGPGCRGARSHDGGAALACRGDGLAQGTGPPAPRRC